MKTSTSLWQLCMAGWRQCTCEAEAVSRPLCIMYSLIHYKETEGSFACTQHAFSLHSLSNQISPSEGLRQRISPVRSFLCRERKNRPSLVREKHFHHNANDCYWAFISTGFLKSVCGWHWLCQEAVPGSPVRSGHLHCLQLSVFSSSPGTTMY